MALTKKGQIEITFNWIYILIAGTVILLFFVGLVYKQKVVSEEKLTTGVVEILDSILQGASVAEKTKNFVNTGGIADYTLQFSCDEGVSNYGIKDSPFQEENSVTPIFSLPSIQTSRLVFWSLPYKLPYKIIDLLFITSANTNYVFLGVNDFVNEFLDATQESDPFLKIATDSKNNINEVRAGGNTYLRLIDVDGAHGISDNQQLPANLKDIDEERITAVVFRTAKSVDFFIAQNGRWKKTNFNQVNLVSLSGERDAAKYAAIFAGNDKIYECNMAKAFKRMIYLDEVYKGKVEDLIAFYDNAIITKSACLTYLANAPQDNLQTVLGRHHALARSCVLENKCGDLVEPSQKIISINGNMESEGCVKLY